MSASTISRFSYRAFISYSHHDKAWADWLHRSLETYRVPPRLVGQETAHGLIPARLAPIFRDREELATATDLSLEIDEALAKSECLVVICSPASAASRWVNEEVLTFKRMGRIERIFCLIVAGEPNATDLPGRASEECLCPALRYKLDDKGRATRTRTEPIAADARRGSDGKLDAKLKLIAGILGIAFDKLKQREQHRRMRRMGTITALALAVMAMTSVLAVAALFARNDAVIAQASAERHQKQAEDLVGFMLGDLNGKLDQMQRLDIIQSVNDKAMAYFDSLPSTDVSDTTLAQRAKALEKIGVVRMGAGNLAGALDAFHASVRISAQLAAADAGSVVRQVAWSRTLAFIGTVHWQQNRLAEAQQDFELTLPTMRKLAALPDAEAPVLFQLAMLANNLGRVLEARAQPRAAFVYYRERLELSQRLVATDPHNSDYVSALGGVHSNLGRLALQRGDLLAAIAEYQADDAIESRLSNADHNDNIQRQSMLEARANLGRTLALAGETALGTANLVVAIDMARQLARFEPDNAGFRLDLALYSSDLARMKRLDGDMQAARTLTADAVGILAQLVRRDPHNKEWQKYSAAAVLEQAAQSHASGRDALAREQAHSALQRLGPIRDARPGERNSLLLAVAARLQMAEAATNKASARTLAQRALQSIQSLDSDTEDPRLLALQVQALLMLDNCAQAQPLVARLHGAGYRDAALLEVLRRKHIEYAPNIEFQSRLLAMVQSASGQPRD